MIDSHTGGMPTRVIVEGGPDLGSGTLAERKLRFAQEFDAFRMQAILEPRGLDAAVGALLCPPSSPDDGCCTGVIFFNNTGYLDMCGHGTIGLMVTLAHLGLIGAGRHRLDTPVGVVNTELLGPNTVSVENVPSYRLVKNVSVQVEGLGEVTGSIAWGGNWFFLVERAPVPLQRDNIPALTKAGTSIRHALVAQSITGADGAEIDHVEFFETPASGPEGTRASSRNFVLCPGLAYDRSPCGTGTSAKLACLAADGKLAPGEEWIQESIIGSRFRGSYRRDSEGRVVPTIIGDAHITARSELIFQPGDPFREGIG
ncbi:proline racemase family protein [Qipengyuania sp. DSG2-2]|uniref:proline racemase family protein n=1 Tax=Qipengyuania sp. DGS2-2 TaxID=3349631 RepID=UPI0036D4288D